MKKGCGRKRNRCETDSLDSGLTSGSSFSRNLLGLIVFQWRVSISLRATHNGLSYTLVLFLLSLPTAVNTIVMMSTRYYCTIPTDCSCHVTRYLYCSSDKLFTSP